MKKKKTSFFVREINGFETQEEQGEKDCNGRKRTGEPCVKKRRGKFFKRPQK